jgi:D-alanyl-D-alanine carboxypeptidase/D-alanyl-D-alanine-endopeptidase (penicillin-binding protein 4)
VLATGLLVAASSVATIQPVSAQDPGSLTKDLDAILANPALAGADIGLVVRAADTGEVLYRHESDRRQQPASNAKLVTSASALEVLGPDYRFSTSVRSSGERRGPVLQGDLYLRGTGDPTMLAADYDALAAKVADSGVKVVVGDLVADDTWFDTMRLASGWAWDDEPFYYDAQVSALTASPDTDFDAGSIIVTVTPGTAGQPVRVTTTPPTDYVRIVNSAVTGAPGSGSNITVDREHGTNNILVTGSMATDASADNEFMAVWEPTGYAAALFRSALQAHGVRLIGRTTRGATPEGAATVAERQSIPLSQLLTPFLKLSNNLHAEILVKAMGRAKSNTGTWDAGIAAMKGVLPGFGIDPARMFLVDGSGLSRMDHIAPDQISALLLAARAKPWFQTWYTALPIAGIPDRLVGGTLRNRMRNTAAANNVHAKTGSFTGASALSGYVTAATGRQLVFSMITNNSVGISLRTVEDTVAIRLAGDTSAAALAPLAVAPSDRRSELEWCAVKAC